MIAWELLRVCHLILTDRTLVSVDLHVLCRRFWKDRIQEVEDARVAAVADDAREALL